MLKTKNSDYDTLRTEMPFLPPSFTHSHINQYGCLFTSGPRITISHLESIRGGNWHVLTMVTHFSCFLAKGFWVVKVRGLEQSFFYKHVNHIMISWTVSFRISCKQNKQLDGYQLIFSNDMSLKSFSDYICLKQ